MNTPVLFIIFNRPETTIRVFEAIRQAKPKQLFIAADGPRKDKAGEAERCAEARRIATNVDWDCEVKTLFREENIGCGRGPAEAITWFFNHVEQGIILEDDCLPDQSFFKFCEDLLDRYQDDININIISGFNQLGGFNQTDDDYIFSKWGGIWGWATWRRAWRKYNYNVPEWKDVQIRKKVLQNLNSKEYQRDMEQHLDKVASGGKVDFWDFQWWFYRLLQNGTGIIPKHTLITNIGFGPDATHTFNISDPLAALKSTPITFPLSHPKSNTENKAFEFQILRSANQNFTLKAKSNRLFKKIKNKLRFNVGK